MKLHSNLILIFLVLASFAVSFPAFAEDYIPDWCFFRDPDFNTQKYLEKKKCFLAWYRIDGQLPSSIIDKWSRATGTGQRVIINRMQTEHSILFAHIEGDTYIFPNGKKRKLKWVLAEVCGYRLKWRINGKRVDPRPYLGFEKQIMFCAKAMRTYMDQYHYFPYALFAYDDNKGGMNVYCDSRRYLWPGDFKK